MSRRKQGRPQQRLTVDSVEQENDLLVCGDCQTNFPLRDITKFIRHKVNKCNKENVENEQDGYDGDCDADESGTVISHKRTPISAPIAKKESFDSIIKSPRQGLDTTGSTDVKSDEENEEEAGNKDAKNGISFRLPFQLRPVVDAECNTTNSEPLKFTCETCRKPFSSAWYLLQHAQREHGMRIYVTSSRESYTPSQSPRVSTPIQKSPKSSDSCREQIKKDERRERDDISIKERIRSDSTEPHRTTSVGSASSGEGSLSSHPSMHNPFMFPRMPFPDVRHPLSPITGMSPLSRPPNDLRLGFGGDPFHPRGTEGLTGFFGIPGFEPGHTAPFHPFEARSRTGMSLDDFYSQRLRQLASSTSPSPARKQTPPFTQSSNAPTRSSGTYSSLTPPAGNSSEPEKHRGESSQRSLTPPENRKSCEFCGKTFRFQSNLIVHRRSHTGEKPFKCPLCPHACTQQSKLKRHMKTHMSKQGGGNSMGSSMSNTSEGSHASSSSTPNSNEINGEDEEGDEDEEEYEEMEEDEMDTATLQEMTDERRMIETAEREKDQMVKRGNDELVARLFDRKIEETITSELSKNSDNPDKKGSGSLISEVMENTGLRSIPNYNEALKLAMAEKFIYSPNDEHSRNFSNNDANAERMLHMEDKERGLKRDKPHDSSIMSISKMIKKEPHEKIGTPPVSVSPAQRINHSMEPSFYPSLWFPAAAGPPDFFNRYPLPNTRFKMGNGIGGEMPHNGFSLPPSSSESALDNMNVVTSSSSSGSTPTTPLPTNGMAPSVPPRKDRNRKDTCDYCGKVFKNCSNLTVHRRSHTGEKPYKCVLCSYACAQSSKLTRHMKTHGRFGKDVYKCKFCAMPFSVPSTLEKHMRKCVENANAVLDGEDTGSNSDAASITDIMPGMSGPTTPMSLPTTPQMSLASSLGLSMPFSVPNSFETPLKRDMDNNNRDGDDPGSNSDATFRSFSAPNTFEKHMRKVMDHSNASVDGDDTGSNSDSASVSESMSVTSGDALLSASSHLGPTSSAASGIQLGLNKNLVTSSFKSDNMFSQSLGSPSIAASLSSSPELTGSAATGLLLGLPKNHLATGLSQSNPGLPLATPMAVSPPLGLSSSGATGFPKSLASSGKIEAMFSQSPLGLPSSAATGMPLGIPMSLSSSPLGLSHGGSGVNMTSLGLPNSTATGLSRGLSQSFVATGVKLESNMSASSPSI